MTNTPGTPHRTSPRGPIPWMGGKSRLARRILARFGEHECYCEPFAGGAHVFWAKERSKVEVLNDLDGHLLNFYRVVQRAPRRLARLVAAMPHSRALWNRLKGRPPYWRLPLYQHNFADADHSALAEALRRLQGAFVMSYNDVPPIRKLYAWATVEETAVVYATRKDRTRPGAELLITP